MSRAENLCDEFDASVFTGDAFLMHSGAEILKEFAQRWLREAERTLNNPEFADEKFEEY